MHTQLIVNSLTTDDHTIDDNMVNLQTTDGHSIDGDNANSQTHDGQPFMMEW